MAVLKKRDHDDGTPIKKCTRGDELECTLNDISIHLRAAGRFIICHLDAKHRKNSSLLPYRAKFDFPLRAVELNLLTLGNRKVHFAFSELRHDSAKLMRASFGSRCSVVWHCSRLIETFTLHLIDTFTLRLPTFTMTILPFGRLVAMVACPPFT